jgi:hypothetical protein
MINTLVALGSQLQHELLHAQAFGHEISLDAFH